MHYFGSYGAWRQHFELVPMVAAALVAAAAMVATGCIGPNEARKSIEWETLLLIAASFGLARAIEKTGLDELLAQSTIGAAGDRPYLVLAAIYFVTMIFTETMSNNAAAVLIFPIAWQTATDLGLNPMPFIMAITVAASCGFASPLGYQTNLMVYGPGGYKFSDYLRFGGPLNLDSNGHHHYFSPSDLAFLKSTSHMAHRTIEDIGRQCLENKAVPPRQHLAQSLLFHHPCPEASTIMSIQSHCHSCDFDQKAR